MRHSRTLGRQASRSLQDLLFFVALLVASGLSTRCEAASHGPPQSEERPTLSGTARERETLTVDDGTWRGATPMSFSYRWLACSPSHPGQCTAIPGAQAKSFTLTAAQVGKTVRAEVTATNVRGSDDARTATSDPVVWAPPRNLARPALVGTGFETEPLDAQPGTWEGNVTSEQLVWHRCDAAGCAPLAVSGTRYVPGAAEVGAQFTIEEIATGPGGSTSALSDPVVIRALPPRPLSPPEISGLARDGEVLTATAGTWAGTVNELHYQWLRCASAQACAPVGSDGPSYRVVPLDVGASLQVEVTALNAAGSASSTSAPTAPVVGTPPSVQRAPWIAGALTVGQVLSAGRGEWAGTPPLAYGYQWLRCDPQGSSCVAISGATGLRYAIASADVGHALRLEVTVSNGTGSTTATSESSGEVRSGYAQEVLADAPLGYWRFGETGGGTAHDASGHGVDGSFFGGATQGSEGALPDGDRAATFDGSSGRVGFGDDFDLQGFSPFTFEAWIRPTVNDAWHRRIVEKEEKDSAGHWQGYRMALNSSLGVYCERWSNGSNAGLTSTGANSVPLNVWTHVACTYDGIRIRMYLNGVLVKSGAYYPNQIVATSAPFTLGSFSGGGSSSWFAGELDDVAVYGTALSATRLQAHVTAAVAEAPVAFASPAADGRAVPGRLLTGSSGTWSGALPLGFAWQWQRCDASGANCVDIAAATSAEYRVTDADVGSTLRLQVSASNAEGTQVASSAPTPVVPRVTPVFKCVEAEQGTLSGAARVWAGAPETVGGTVVLGPQGTGELAIPFDLPDAQPVTLWARVRAQSRSNHALRVTLAEEGFSAGSVWDVPVTPVLRWQRISRRGASGSELLPMEPDWPGALAAGAHTLRLQGEEPGVELDAVCISTADVEPDERLPEPPTRTVTRSVADFGAVGDGVTDDTQALQAAFDALAPGDALYVPAGRYRFTSTLTLNRHHVTIVGAGPGSVLFADLSATATGNAINVAGGYEGAYYLLQADAVATDHEVRVASTVPLAAGDVVLLTEDDWGPQAPNLSALFYRNRAHLAFVTAVRSDGADAVLTLDRPLQSDFLLAHNARVQRFNGLRDVVVSHLRIEGTAQPVSADNADVNLMLVNRCVRCFFSDLELAHARKSAIELGRNLDSSAIRVHVSDVTDTGGGGHGYGIAVTRSQGVIVRDSVFDGVIRHGVPISWGSRETFVYRNLFDRSAAQPNKFASVDIHGEDDYANLVEDNVITGGTEALIVGGGGSSHGNDGAWNVLRHNRVEGAVDAISVYKSSFHTVVDGNSVVGATRYPVRVESGSADALVCSNRIEGYAGAGIRVMGSDRVQVLGNQVVPGSGPAVELDGSTGYAIIGNSLGGEAISVPSSLAASGTISGNY